MRARLLLAAAVLWLALPASAQIGKLPVIEDETTALTVRERIRMVGSSVTCADSGGKTVCTFTSGSGGHTILDETSAMTARTNLSFVGPDVTVTDNAGADRTVVTIPDLVSVAEIQACAQGAPLVAGASVPACGSVPISDHNQLTNLTTGHPHTQYPSQTRNHTGDPNTNLACSNVGDEVTQTDPTPDRPWKCLTTGAAGVATWVRIDGGGAGGGAPTNANYVVTSADTTLTLDKVLTAGALIDIPVTGTDGGAATVDVDLTEMGATATFGDNTQASMTWTWNLSGTDVVVANSSGLVTITGGLTTSGNWTIGTGANATQTITGNIVTGTDPVITLSDGLVNVTTGNLASNATVIGVGAVQLGHLTPASASCLDVDTDRPYADKDCDGAKGAGEEYLDLTSSAPGADSVGVSQLDEQAGSAAAAVNLIVRVESDASVDEIEYGPMAVTDAGAATLPAGGSLAITNGCSLDTDLDCPQHATLGGQMQIFEGADDGANFVAWKVSDDPGLGASFTYNLDGSGRLPAEALQPAVGGSGITDAHLEDGAVLDAKAHAIFTRDTEDTLECATYSNLTPADADDLYHEGYPYAVTIARYRCIAKGGGTISLTIQECGSDGTTCVSSDSAIICDSDGTAWDTALTDAAIDANDWQHLLFGAPSGTVNSVTLTACYTRDVVQAP